VSASESESMSLTLNSLSTVTGRTQAGTGPWRDSVNPATVTVTGGRRRGSEPDGRGNLT
jgi:hypothetical protein